MAKYNFIEERTMVENHLTATWDTATYPIIFQHTTMEPDEDSQVFVRFSITQSTTLQDTFRSDGGGTKTVSTVVANINVKKNAGTHVVRNVLQALSDTFDNVSLDSGSFYFGLGSVGYGTNLDLKTGYNQTNWTISFTRK